MFALQPITTCHTIECIVVLVVSVIVYRLTRPKSPILRFPGPPNPSWWVGHMPQLTGGNVGDPTLDWLRTYGRAYSANTYFGEPLLVLTDPAACSYVLKNYGTFPRRSAEIALISYVLGKDSLAVTIDEKHVRQRRVIQPAFNLSSLRNMFPTFVAHADQLRHHWHQQIADSQDEVLKTNVTLDLSALTAESLAAFAFGREMGHVHRLGKVETPYVTSLRGLFIEGTAGMKKIDWVLRGVSGLMPHRLMIALSNSGLAPKIKAVLDHHSVLHQFAKDVVAEQTKKGKGDGAELPQRNVMSVLIKANKEEKDPARKLQETEVIDQVASLLVGGQDTTSLEAAFVLYELALHPEFQTLMREEIREARRERGEGPSDYADLESLPLLAACIKETSRVHPVVPVVTRQSNREAVVPFSEPIRLRDGSFVSNIALPKGSSIAMDIAGYNRDFGLWGDDADEWKPSRWLEDHVDVNMHREKKLPGVYEHLLSFSDGQAHCLGWRFALLELHTIIATLVEDFEFKLQGSKIDRMSAAVMGPVADGDHSMFSMPLEIRVAAMAPAMA